MKANANHENLRVVYKFLRRVINILLTEHLTHVGIAAKLNE